MSSSTPWSLRCPANHSSLEYCRPHQERPYRCVACGAFYRRRELTDLSLSPRERERAQRPEATQQREEADPHGGPVTTGAVGEGSLEHRGADVGPRVDLSVDTYRGADI